MNRNNILKSISILFIPIFLASCSDGKLIKNEGKCHSIENTSDDIRSFTVLLEYRNDLPETHIVTLKPGEQVLLNCPGSISLKISGNVKINPNNYIQHKSMDTWPYNRKAIRLRD